MKHIYFWNNNSISDIIRVIDIAFICRKLEKDFTEENAEKECVKNAQSIEW